MLRPYQSTLVSDVYQAWGHGAQNVCMRLPTGGGKTRCLASILQSHQGAACVMAHRNELVVQVSIALARAGVRHRIIAADENIRAIVREHIEVLGRSFYEANSPCAVASVDTLIRRPDLAAWAAQVTLWIIDEAHHLLRDNKWGRAVAMFTNVNCRGLGPTATPERADGKGLGRHADGLLDIMVHGPEMRWLIDNRFLSDYDLICPKSDLHVIGKLSKDGDWSPKQLREAARHSHIVGDVVDAYIKRAWGKRWVTFCTDIETAEKTTAEYIRRGVPAGLITGETDGGVRRHIIKQIERGEVWQLVAVDIVSEGFDLPALQGASMGRPTESLPMFHQMFGRPMRVSGEDERILIIDHVSNTVTHNGPPDRPRPWSLDRRIACRSGTGDGIPYRVCLECLRPFERFRVACPHCGSDIPPPQARSTPKQVEGDLVLLDAEALAILRGEVEQLDKHPAIVGREALAHGVPPVGATAAQKKQIARQEAQATLREAMGWWGGWAKSRGFSDREAARLFWSLFGLDVMSAQALDPGPAGELEAKIREALNVQA